MGEGAESRVPQQMLGRLKIFQTTWCVEGSDPASTGTRVQAPSECCAECPALVAGKVGRHRAPGRSAGCFLPEPHGHLLPLSALPVGSLLGQGHQPCDLSDAPSWGQIFTLATCHLGNSLRSKRRRHAAGASGVSFSNRFQFPSTPDSSPTKTQGSPPPYSAL